MVSNQSTPNRIPFCKYQALGNDYLVLRPDNLDASLSPAQIQYFCHRHYGAGSDGILLGPLPVEGADFGLRIFNPDGSEAEKSGNGLRIFARYLWDQGLVVDAPFTVWTAGGIVHVQVHSNGEMVTVEMGQVRFDSQLIPMKGRPREVINETLVVGGQDLQICAATIGNPHCVVTSQLVTEAEARRLGPLIEHHYMFPNRTNVQFLEVRDRQSIRIEIWERGAGYTLASGSSSCASAAVAHRLGLCDASVAVHMPGGLIRVEISPDYEISMTGPVTGVYEGVFWGLPAA